MRRPLRNKMPRGLAPCTRKHTGAVSGLRFCLCRRCVLVRAIALRRVGPDADLPGAVITRALTENA